MNMDTTPEAKSEPLDFAVLPMGDRLVTAVPLRRFDQEAVISLMLAPAGGHQYLAATQLLLTALSPADAEEFETMDFGDAFNTVAHFLRTQGTDYQSVALDLDTELKDLIDE